METFSPKVIRSKVRRFSPLRRVVFTIITHKTNNITWRAKVRAVIRITIRMCRVLFARLSSPTPLILFFSENYRTRDTRRYGDAEKVVEGK